MFDNDTVGNGLETGLFATGSAATFGIWNGGSHRCDPGFATSAMLAGVGRDALTTAIGMGWAAKAAEAGEAANAARGVEQACENGCFVAGTPVQMAGGSTKPIEEIKPGDSVMSRNPKTGKNEAKTVLHSFVHHRVVTLILKFEDGDRIETTAVHPFYVKDKGFVPAGRLRVGDAVVTRAGPPSKIISIRQTGQRKAVYNIEVADDHTYFVGAVNGGAWVHNALLCKVDPCSIRFSQNSIDSEFANGDLAGTSLDDAIASARASVLYRTG